MVSRLGQLPVLRFTLEDCRVSDACDRTKLICDITKILGERDVPEGTRLAGLTLIGWLARRRPEEMPDDVGVAEARESERRLRTVRSKQR